MKITNPTLRVIAGLIMLAAIIWGYSWIACVLALIFLCLFPLYYEIIFWGIMYDALYGTGTTYMFSLSSIVLFLIAFFVRKQLLSHTS